MSFNFRRRVSEVEAFQHDGSEDSAIKISNWMNLHNKGYSTVIPTGAEESGYDSKFAYIRFSKTTPRALVAPGSWVVKLSANMFYTLTNEEFTLVYEPVKKETHD